MHCLTKIILSAIFLITLFQSDQIHAANYEGFLPKNITGVSSFLEDYPEYDGRNIKIAVLDSGVDPGAPGLSSTSNGLPKLMDILDATGSGDVDTSTIKTPDNNAQVEGLSGRIMQLNPKWIKKDATIHLGVVNGFDIFPGNVISVYKRHARKQMEETNEIYIQEIKKQLDALKDDGSADEKKKQDLDDRLELLNQMGKSYEAPSPIFDCVVFQMDGQWRVAIDTDEDSDFTDEVLLQDYSIMQEYAQFGSDTLVNFGVHTYNDGNLLSIIIPSSAHGTHVAGIIGAHFPDEPQRNGIAPGAQIISIKIGDTRLDGMETGIALQRALRMVKDLDCDLINMSYGEPTSTPNHGWFIEQVDELVREENVIFVASAGNAGPALSSVGAPGGTSSRILAVGAYVHSSMMGLQYGMAHTPQDNLYTWSSRGPTLDGDLGVNFCAPGGAIAPVPTSSQVPAMQMNGTSMASPYACGSLALILNGLKSNDISFSPYGVKIAVEETAQKQKHLDTFSQGYGLIQIDEAFEHLKSTTGKNITTDFEIQNLSQSSGRGIYLRDYQDLQSTHSLRVQPSFKEDTEALIKAEFEVWASLTCEANWVTFPDSILIHQNGGKMTVSVDSKNLRPGAHSTIIKGKDKSSGKTLFKVPVSVIVPIRNRENEKVDWNQTIRLEPGGVKRLFITPPSWAKWAEVTIDSDESIVNNRIALHTVQVLQSQRFNAVEWKRYIPGPSLKHYQTSIPVQGNPTMEWAFASYWSNKDSMELNIKIKFQGLEGVQKTYHIPAGGIPISGNLQGIEYPIALQPHGELSTVEFSLLPTNSSIYLSKDPRDILVNDEELHRLDLTYKWKNSTADTLNISWNALAEVIYDSPYSSLLWSIENPQGRTITYDDAWSNPVKIDKGIHQIDLSIWHEDKQLLEPLKILPVIISHPMTKKISIQLETNLKAAAAADNFDRSRFQTVQKGENQTFWLSTKELPAHSEDSSKIQRNYSGNVQWIDSKKHHGATFISKILVSPSSEFAHSSKRPNQTKEHKFSADLASEWWQFRIERLKHLSQLEDTSIEFDALYHELLDEKPGSTEVQLILLNRLDDGPNRKKHLDLIIPLLDQMMQQIDVVGIRDYFSVRNMPNSREERNKHSNMLKEKELFLDLLYRKARALAYQETLLSNKTFDFEAALNHLRSWVDTSEPKYRLLDIREHRRNGNFGSALKLLNKSIEMDGNNLKFQKKKIKILQSLNWIFWAQNSQKQTYLNLPQLVRSVRLPD